jgi:AraC-like DNA-binding protein
MDARPSPDDPGSERREVADEASGCGRQHRRQCSGVVRLRAVRCRVSVGVQQVVLPTLGSNLGPIALRARGVRALTRPEHFSPSGGASSAVRTAVDVTGAEAHLPLTLSSNAARSHVCVRTLRRGFQRHLGTSPMAYLCGDRLRGAHQTLLESEPPTMTVTSVAHGLGFTNTGRVAAVHAPRYHETHAESLPGNGRRLGAEVRNRSKYARKLLRFSILTTRTAREPQSGSVGNCNICTSARSTRLRRPARQRVHPASPRHSSRILAYRRNTGMPDDR